MNGIGFNAQQGARDEPAYAIAQQDGRYGFDLFDMAGNVWEWTLSQYRDYPYRNDDGRNDPASVHSRVVRGGSWYDRPKRW